MAAFSASYTLTGDLATAFTPAEVAQLREKFSTFDTSGDGTIDGNELAGVIRNCGETVNDADIPQLMNELDSSNTGSVTFSDFVAYIHRLRTSGGKGDSILGKAMRRTTGLLKVEGAGGASHMFSEEEKIAFSEHINNCLASDPHVARHLPLDVNSYQLFERAGDGLIFCKLINLAVPDTIDERALNKKESLNVYQKTENVNLALNAAKGIGCQVVNIGAQDLIEGRPILILGLLWQIIKMQLLSQISLKNFPELVLLLQDGEDMADLLKLPPEDILLRWFNYHLAKAGSSRRVSNFGNDLKDSECYSILLNQLSPSQCPLCTEPDLTERAQHVIRNAVAIGTAVFIHPADICNGNKKLNMGFVAQLFNQCPGLTINEEELSTFDFASLELDDAGDSREERVFRMWINSLNIPDLYINNLFEDLHDGIGILMLEDNIQPGIVQWKRVTKNTKSRFKKVENCNYAVDIGKQMGFSMVNIGGLDIVDKVKKLILAIIWQLMRKYTLLVLAQLATHEGLTEVTEDHVIQWANRKVASSGKSSSMRNFKDQSLKSGVFLLDLVNAIEPRAVNWELVTAGSTPEEQESNAKYSISIARKIGACVFLTPEDIVEVKSKMIMTFVSSLWATDLQYNRS
mmetsp:Transcript_113/g.206  ORF Transcript_113/g.206 Transcript_113/m.206 type:complete len:631 (+) Transcript_113:113-2005(+)|eukprot:CAMPEP_0185024168 /NCGR_PEP_ID=MMETSP1103-20130426/7130_1 /TAXON_ID=36769 /ORGANISM="Paraphysomonas bandaiensis, Strain Caron Lab Isolate" /LENGTH=630 /DNA_ID=CAMNT_0027557061 /DNA_START=60 /DNA_END=1952 /DNA_ORIENTATION=+